MPTCANLGVAKREVGCNTCAGNVRVKVYECAKHGECTLGRKVGGMACCAGERGEGCPDFCQPLHPFPGPIVRNLIYHLWPVNGAIWRYNLSQLLRRIELFNGRRVLATVESPGCDSVATVKDFCRGKIHELIVLPNNPALREMVTWRPLFERVRTFDPNQITFYAHAKGVTRPHDDGSAIPKWIDLLYHTNLDYVPLVEERLRFFPLAGSLKKVGHGFVGSASRWHYSGTFFWFRNRDVFRRRGWQRIDREWWGTEAWPGLHFAPEEAGTVFMQGVVPTLDLYSLDYVKQTILPELERWQVANRRFLKEDWP